MKQECREYLETIIKNDVIGNNKLITVDEVQQRIHASFCIEYTKEKVKEWLLEKKEIFEIQKNSFVCKTHFMNFYKSIKDKDNIISRINRHYFIRLSDLEIKNLFDKYKSDQEKKEKIFNIYKEIYNRDKNRHENKKIEKETRQEIKQKIEKEEETKIFTAYENLGTNKINYEVEDIEKYVIDFILKTGVSLRFNHIAENRSKAGKEVEEILKCMPYILSKKLVKNNKLFYIASNKNIFFKPLLGALIIDRDIKKVPYKVIENLLVDKLKSKFINRKELDRYLRENNKFFRADKNFIEILCTLEEYLQSIRKKYKVIDNKIYKKIEETTLEDELAKIIEAMKIIEEEAPVAFNINQVEKILLVLLRNEPLSVEEIEEKLWLYKEKISKIVIKEILNNSSKFKCVDFYRYVNRKSLKYSEFKNSLVLEIIDIMKTFTDSQKKVFKLRLLKRMTLEEAAKHVGVTRERVRQIEIKVKGKLELHKKKSINSYLDILDNIFNENKVLTKNELEKEIRKYKAFDKLKIIEIIRIYELFKEEVVNIYFENYYSLIKEKDIYENLNEIEEKVITFDKFKQEFKKIGIKSEDFISNIIKNNKKICKCKNLVMYSNKNINMVDKLQMVFEVEQRELKLAEAADLYNEYYNENNSFRNIIIKLEDKIFTRVFTGIYRLTKWGGQRHIYTADLTVAYLREKRAPATIQEIVENISEKTRANNTTLKALASMPKEVFSYSRGKLALKEWADNFELSKRYYISKNRIEASMENKVGTCNKGKFKKNGKLVSLHCVNKENIIINGGLNLGEYFVYKLFSQILLRYKDLEYKLNISDREEGAIIKGISEVFSNVGIKEGMYFYLVYLNNEIIRLYKWDEFENEIFYKNENLSKKSEENYEKLPKIENTDEINMEISENTEEEKIQNTPIENVEKIWTFDTLLAEGLRAGKVKSKWIDSIDFEEEIDVEDYYDVEEVLQERGIIIVY